jgi:hypothetical protein
MSNVEGFTVGAFMNAYDQKRDDPLAPINWIESSCAGMAAMGATEVKDDLLGFVYGTFTDLASTACENAGLPAR